MVTWGAIISVGLWLVLRDVDPVTKARLMGSPLLIHVIVIGSGLAIHGGSADGAMAAIVSGHLLGRLRPLAAAHARLYPTQSMASRRAVHPGSEEHFMNQDVYAETTARSGAGARRSAVGATVVAASTACRT